MSKPIIKVENISKSYQISHQSDLQPEYSTLKDDVTHFIKKPFKHGLAQKRETFWALKDVSFEVNQGEIFGIIGQNGSGKSTLLKILSRIVEPTSGKATLRGKTASLLEVGTGFHPELTGRENIFFNGSMIGMSRQEIRKKFDEIVAFAEIDKFLDTPVKFYSSGMYVRLAFSVAAHLDSDILILDEVLSVGDSAFQQKSMDKILTTMESGRTVLFVSHGMDTVRELCGRGLLLKKGKVAYIGDTDELIDKYATVTTSARLTAHAKTHYREVKNDSDYFRVNDISISNENGDRINASPKSSDKLFVNLNLEIKKTDDNLVIGYVLENDGGSLLYSTYSADKLGLKDGKLPKGKITLRGSIPPSLLNVGGYKVSIMSGIFNKFWIHEPRTNNLPNVKFLISRGLPHVPLQSEPREGLLAPDIDWTINKQ